MQSSPLLLNIVIRKLPKKEKGSKPLKRKATDRTKNWINVAKGELKRREAY